MKKSSRRTLSRLMAGIMLVSSMFSTTFVNASELPLAAYADEVTSGGGDIVSSGGAVEAGKTYAVDFAATDPGDKSAVDGLTFADGAISAEGRAYYHGSGHGLALYNGDIFRVKVAGNAEITFKTCAYSAGDSTYVVTNSAGESLGVIKAKGDMDGEDVTFSYTGDADTLAFEYVGAGSGYLHAITSVNAAAPVGEAENFELWLDDIAYDVTSTTDTGETVVTKTIDQQTFAYKDSTLSLIGNKDAATGELTKFTPSWASGVGVVRAGKTVNGYKAGNRHATANDIPSVPTFGDGTAIVFSPAATGTFNTYFASTSFLRVWDFDATTGERYGYTDSDTAVESYAFKAQAGHTYVLSTTGKTNNMVFCGFEYIIDEPTTVAFSYNNINANEGSISTLEVYLTDAALGTVEGTVKADTAELKLAKGHTYKLSTNDGGVKATINGSDSFKATGDAVVIDLEDIPDQTLTGEITGTPEGTVSGLTFTNQLNGAVYTATITGSTYSCVMKPGEYNTAVVTSNGGVTYDHVSVVQGAENTNEVWVELPDPNYYDLPTEWNNADTRLTITSPTGKYNNSTSVAMYAGDTISVPVSGKQKVTVSGWYAGSWDINGQNAVVTSSSASASTPTTTTYTTDGTETSVTVNILPYAKADGTEVTGPTYLYWIQVEDVIEYKAEINVPGDYDTLNEADDAICAMVRPDGEEGRVTINLNANLEEQVTFDAPYVTLNGNGHELSWYYGVGTFYYSIDKSTGLYSERLFRDKYSSAEGDGNLWGGVAIVRGDNFIAEDATFRNTYNYYVTDKEAADVAYTVGGIPMRTKDTDVTKYASKERSNAFYIAADNIEVYRCNILSSQDTLGRNGSANNNYHTYFKDCVIGGNTDYICGEFTAIFDNCKLQWKTYENDATNNSKVGYITAPKTSPYIFRNCTVTTDGVGTDVEGLYGRTWGANSNAIFINTETNGYIKADGWGQMSSGDGPTANFKEYGNTNNGEAFATTPDATLGIPDTTLSDEDAAVMTSDDVIAAYLAGWTPVHYSYELRFTGMWGDADKSGILTANDASAVLAYVLDASLAENDNYDFAGCDVDDSGEITAADAAMILQKVLDADFAFPVEPTTEATTEMPVDENAYYVPADKAELAYAKTVVYNGVDASVMAMQDMDYKVNSDGTSTTIGDITYAGYAVSTSVNTSMTVDGVANPGYRVAYAVTAKNDVTVSIDVKVNQGKSIILTTEEPAENAVITSVKNFKNTAADMFTTVSASIKAGETLYIIGQGTNLPIFGIRFTPNENPVGDPAKIFVVGDSTACHYAEGADVTDYYKRVGFGDKLDQYINAEVVNLALSGRSSKSYLADPEYQTLLDSMKEGDYLIIAFGHNDEKTEEDRYTAPGGTKDTEGTFKNSLYTNYILKAQEVGATPILATPIVRRTTGTWSDNQLHVANGGDYAQDVRDLGAELGLTVIDNLTLTKDLYDTLTPNESKYLHRWYLDSSVDNTHLNNYGAMYVAYMMAEAIKASDSTLAPYVKSGNVAPTKADLIVNPDWTEPSTEDVKGDDLLSRFWTTSTEAGWYGTLTGDFGGMTKLCTCDAEGNPVEPIEYTKTGNVTNFALIENADGTVNLRCGVAKNDATLGDDAPKSDATFGKIASTSDGFMMYYTPVSASTDFTISGTITLNGYQEKNSQVAYGAIVADTISVDTYNASAINNYVAASPLKIADINKEIKDATTGEVTGLDTGWAGYARINGTLTEYADNGGLTVAPAVGDTVNVSITKKGNEYTVNYGGQVSTFTVEMSDQVYVGFFAARCANITISNIDFNNEIVE